MVTQQMATSAALSVCMSLVRSGSTCSSYEWDQKVAEIRGNGRVF